MELNQLKQNKIICEQQFNEALQNFRGLMGSLQSTKSPKTNNSKHDTIQMLDRVQGVACEQGKEHGAAHSLGRVQSMDCERGMAFGQGYAEVCGYSDGAWYRQSFGPKINVSDYKILGEASLTKEQGIAALKLIYRNEPLNKLASNLLERLADLVHARLELFNELNGYHYRGLVVGMSGGADSTLALVLACALRDKYGYRALAIHCIHRLDPDDDIWLTNNERLCEALKVELRTPVLNIVYGNGVSPEDSSRNERYKALIANTKEQEDCLVLGHQADDQVESFLLALKRGSGPHGLRGMRFLIQDERGVILRPLLNLHKIEVEQILVSLNYEYVFDLSNQYLKFERNFMRLKVLPKLRERFSAIDRSILRSQALCTCEHDLASRYVQEQLPKYLKLNSNAISINGQLLPQWSLNFKELDLGDSNLVTMLLRAFYQKVIVGGVDFNVIERSYELMVKAHDKNGLIELNLPPTKLLGYQNEPKIHDSKASLQGPNFNEQLSAESSINLALGAISNGYDKACLCAATFLNYLQVFIKDVDQELSALSGIHELKLNENLALGPYCYSLQPCKTPEDYKASFVVSNKVLLDFNKSGSLKLKPISRNHSRELKKLFIEYEIAPWLRKAQPLVKNEAGSILALGNIFTNDYAYIQKAQSSILQSSAPAAASCQAQGQSQGSEPDLGASSSSCQGQGQGLASCQGTSVTLDQGISHDHDQDKSFGYSSNPCLSGLGQSQIASLKLGDTKCYFLKIERSY